MKDFNIDLTSLVDKYISEEQHRLNLYTTIRKNIENKEATLLAMYHYYHDTCTIYVSYCDMETNLMHCVYNTSFEIPLCCCADLFDNFVKELSAMYPNIRVSKPMIIV